MFYFHVLLCSTSPTIIVNSSTVVSYRLTNLKLPLDHKESDLRSEVLNFLSLQDDELLDLYVFRRGYDARKKSNIHFIYTLDLQFSADVDVIIHHPVN